ncbi:amidohydrolase family protein [Nocardia sp. NBC_01327]|uniref:amidohydrolase family protein n=1 Tax=Nocardia sp. NBC_01327 TaxID=2903593 RepID=UPI002E0F8769|nr:amidohydrolase [Nocardia sp. NBC_01327]
MTQWLDVHAHYVTDHYAAVCRAAGHERPDGMPGIPGWSVESARELMESTGVAAAVLSISSPGVHFGSDSLGRDSAARDLAAHVNDAGAAIVTRAPERFGVAAVLPLPDVDGALAEIARAYDQLGADAVAMKTNYHGRYLADPEFDAVLGELDRRGAVALLHPTSPPGWEVTALGRPRPMLEFLFDTTRCVLDLVMSGVITRYPGIRWVIPHAGAVLPAVAHRASLFTAITGEPMDVPAALGRLYYDLAGLPLPIELPALLGIVGPERLLYGSDFPFTPAPAVAALAGVLAQAPELAGAQLGLTPGSAGAQLFPRLAGRQV